MLLLPVTGVQAEPGVRLRYNPVRLDAATEFLFVSPFELTPVVNSLSSELREIHEEYRRFFGGDLPALNTTLEIMTERQFFRATGAPSWTNAMFYKGKIILPYRNSSRAERENLSRSLRHEYAHAVLHSLSGGRCPGWLDEGLAQLLEGHVNPALEPTLKRWLRKNPPVDFKYLQGGFTELEREMVPAAYAQSLFAARSLMKDHGAQKVVRFLTKLQEGSGKHTSFRSVFGESLTQFEETLGRSLVRWSRESVH